MIFPSAFSALVVSVPTRVWAVFKVQTSYKLTGFKTLEINWFEAVIAVVDAVLLDIVANDELVGKDYDLT